MLKYIGEKYRPIVIRENIEEAWALLRSNESQIFYFDDFLGSTGRISRLNRNEDKSILRLIKYVNEHTHVRFILTTREYILRDAKLHYQSLDSSEIELRTCIIEMDSYTRSNKAHILFNHLYASSLTRELIKPMLDRQNILKIVDHDRYSPRIIEAMTDLNKVKSLSPQDFPKHFIRTLDDPTAVWRHIFTMHLSKPCQSLLIVVATFPYAVDIRDLEAAYNALRANEVRHLGDVIEAYDFRNSLNTLESTFLRYERTDKSTAVFFVNASVRDFLEHYLAENPQHMCILCESLVFYDQVRTFIAPGENEAVRKQILSHLQGTPQLLGSTMLRTAGNIAKPSKLLPTAQRVHVQGKENVESIEQNTAHILHNCSLLPQEEVGPLAAALLESTIEERRSDISAYEENRADMERDDRGWREPSDVSDDEVDGMFDSFRDKE